MRVTLSAEELRLVTLFESETEAVARDCLVDDERVVFVIASGEMGQAIGAGGDHVKRVERKLGKSVRLVEDATRAEDFVANALAPAAVYNVTVSDGEETTVAYAEVADDDRGAAIGKDGQNIETARRLAKRHFDIDEIELT